MLARKEVELTLQGERFLNQALLAVFSNRSFESIKGKRKQAKYRQMVSDMLQGSTAEAEETEEVENEELIDETPYRKDIEIHLQSLSRPDTGEFSAVQLAKICSSLPFSDPSMILTEISLYLRNVFSPETRRKHERKVVAEATLSKKQARRAEYARVQELYKKNRTKCLRMLLDDISDVRAPQKEEMVPSWEAIMKNDTNKAPGGDECRLVIANLWAPITMNETRKALPANTTSAGPDGLTARLFKKVPLNITTRILNILMWCSKAPEFLLESFTTLIPKKSHATLPADFRSITVSSVIMRTLHKVLASRMAREIKLDQRQRAFRPTDGCSDNIFLLDLILRHCHVRNKPLFMASLDIAKVFDSVSHAAIEKTLSVMSLPQPMISYIKSVYQRSTTVLSCGGWTSDQVRPTCGVKQGDPMSPVIFNMVIDRLLTRLPEEVGVRCGDVTVNAAAFADDMLLFASTPMGLQKMLDLAVDYLNGCALMVNAGKCMTVALRNVPHEKKTVVDKNTVFVCEGRTLSALKRSDEWRYLGVPFSPEGRLKLKVVAELRDSLEKLSRAPLKPQQRLFALRTMVIPGLYHKLELGDININTLRKSDKILRVFGRK